MGLVQDGILGSYLLSDPGARVPRGVFLELRAVLLHSPGRAAPPPEPADGERL
jgi:hypothetical protein